MLISVSSVQSLSRVQLFATPWTAARQTSLSITNSWSLLRLMSIESVMPSNCLILSSPFSSRLQSFPASRSFPMSQFFASSGQSIGFQLQHQSFQRNPRADLLQNGLVRSLCSPRDSQESSPTPQFKSINKASLKVQFSSVTQSCPTLCDPMDCSMPGLPAHHQLPESAQTHVHRVGDAIQPSHPLSSPSPPAFSLSQHQGLFQ